MQKILLFFALLVNFYGLKAQCASSVSAIETSGNNFSARILDDGTLVAELLVGPLSQNPFRPSTAFNAGLWLGALDPAGNLKLTVSDYSYVQSYTAGPLNENGVTDASTCSNWDRHFRVTSAEINDFLAALPLTQAEALAQFPAVMGWPAKGNTTFSDVWGYSLPFNSFDLAGFVDANQNGLYEPLNGDHPAVQLRDKAPFVPDEIIWCVFNDQKGGAVTDFVPLQAEVQLTVWTFHCPNGSLLNNTLFTSHKVINRGTERLDSTRLGLWVDYDLGCSVDDYAGSNPVLQSFFVYNQDAQDGQPGNTCQGNITSFGDSSPVQTLTMLNRPMDKFILYNNVTSVGLASATTDPTSASEYYNYLNGYWRDGTPLTYGGSGYGGVTPTNHIYTGDPGDPNGWSMCSEALAFSDRRALAAVGLGQILPGEAEELHAAWAVHFNAPPPCNLGNAMQALSKLHTLYDNGFDNYCNAVPTENPFKLKNITLFPNPASGDVTLQYTDMPVKEIRIYNTAGTLVEILSDPGDITTVVKTEALPNGIYLLYLVTDQGSLTQKLVVSH